MKNVRPITEGKTRKGGVGTRPTCPRPPLPASKSKKVPETVLEFLGRLVVCPECDSELFGAGFDYDKEKVTIGGRCVKCSEVSDKDVIWKIEVKISEE